MGYDLTPNNTDAGRFHFGAFSFPVLIDACGYLWPVASDKGRWYCVFGADPRMPQGDDYPRLISNDEFPVTEFEAQVMARVARNFVAVQRSLPESHRGSGTLSTQESFNREGLEQTLLRAMSGAPPGPWPVKIRDDFTALFERFAEWAERSGGFTVG
jgi:hypothetical protein